MNIGTAVIVFFVSIIALVAEFILYFIFGFGATFSGDISTLSGVAFFFVGLMTLTAATGVLFPICAVIATITKSKKLGNRILLVLLGIIFAGYFFILPVSIKKGQLTIDKKVESSGVAEKADMQEVINKKQLYKIVDIDTRVTEKASIWWKYAWKLTIRNMEDSGITVDATIEWLDKDGFVIDDSNEYGLYVPGNEEKVFRGYNLIRFPGARNVESIHAKVKKHSIF